MFLIDIELDFALIAIAGLTASVLAALCWQEYIRWQESERVMDKDLENPPAQSYQHDLKAFTPKGDDQ